MKDMVKLDFGWMREFSGHHEWWDAWCNKPGVAVGLVVPSPLHTRVKIAMNAYIEIEDPNSWW
jgi:hypothetical protein